MQLVVQYKPRFLKYPAVLFVLIPFAHWLGAKVTFLYLFFLTIFFLLKNFLLQNLQLNPISIFSPLFSVTFVAISLFRYEGILLTLFESGSLGFPFLTLQATQFFFVIFIVALAGPIDRTSLATFVKYVWLTLVITILVEAIATNFFGVNSKYFFGYLNIHAYVADPGTYQRPFGLIGSAPMNGSILVILLWLYLGLQELPLRGRIWAHTATVVALLFNQSGQATLTYVAGWIFLFFRPSFKGWFKVLIGVLVFHLVLSYGKIIHYKLTYDYLKNTLRYLHIYEYWRILTPGDVIFGAMTNAKEIDHIVTEFYPVHALSRYGILHTLTQWTVLFLPLLKRSANKHIYISLISVLIGSLHYASVYIIFLQVPLAMYLVNATNFTD
jgi:hypothetical protein